MTYKLLALDIDGTLLQTDMSILPEVMAAIKRLQSQGVYIILATGRAFPSAKKYADILNLNSPLICYNGAVIRTGKDSEPVFQQCLPLPLMEEIIVFGEERDWYLQLYNNDAILVAKTSEHTLADPDFANMPTIETGRLSAAKLQPSPKIMTRCTPEEVAARLGMLKASFGERLYIVGSTPHLLEMMCNGVSKAHALHQLCNHYRISPSEIVACGDGDNDRDMLSFAGVGCAVANAVSSTKNEANYVCAATNGHGVLEAINRYFDV